MRASATGSRILADAGVDLIALEMITGVEHGEPALEAARVLAAYIRALSAE
jgi:hypothetical protein